MRALFKLIRKPFFGPYEVPWRWPEGVDPGAWERVEFDSETGSRLVGLFGRAEGAAKGAVLCSHPVHREAKGYFLKRGHADVLRRAGYNVLVWDLNGFGESPHGNLRLQLDSLAAGKKLAELSPGLRVALYGLSAGASYGLCSFSREDHPFSAAVLEACFTSLDEYWRRYRFPSAVLRAASALMPGVAAGIKPIEQIKRVVGTPALLFIHGEKDSHTPPSMGERLMAASSLPRDRMSMWVVPDAKHNGALDVAGDEYWRRVLEFLARELAR